MSLYLYLFLSVFVFVVCLSGDHRWRQMSVLAHELTRWLERERSVRHCQLLPVHSLSLSLSLFLIDTLIHSVSLSLLIWMISIFGTLILFHSILLFFCSSSALVLVKSIANVTIHQFPLHSNSFTYVLLLYFSPQFNLHIFLFSSAISVTSLVFLSLYFV